jgi:hypothetical protein
MKRILKIVVIIFIVAFIAAQFFRPDRTNPPIVQAETLEATTDIPDNVAQILRRSCNDCHSNQTIYPWYSNLTPFSWLLKNHIDEGRAELNFSVWNTYDAKKKARKLDEICDQVISGEMPHSQYLWIHRDAILSDEDKKLLCDWEQAEREKIRQTQ